MVIENNEEKSFWVLKNNIPQLVKGFLIKQNDEDAWCGSGVLEFHEINEKNQHEIYTSWFESKIELLEDRVKSAEFMITFEKEMFESELEELEAEKNKWISLLEKEKENA